MNTGRIIISTYFRSILFYQSRCNLSRGVIVSITNLFILLKCLKEIFLPRSLATRYLTNEPFWVIYDNFHLNFSSISSSSLASHNLRSFFRHCARFTIASFRHLNNLSSCNNHLRGLIVNNADLWRQRFHLNNNWCNLAHFEIYT